MPSAEIYRVRLSLPKGQSSLKKRKKFKGGNFKTRTSLPSLWRYVKERNGVKWQASSEESHLFQVTHNLCWICILPRKMMGGYETVSRPPTTHTSNDVDSDYLGGLLSSLNARRFTQRPSRDPFLARSFLLRRGGAMDTYICN